MRALIADIRHTPTNARTHSWRSDGSKGAARTRVDIQRREALIMYYNFLLKGGLCRTVASVKVVETMRGKKCIAKSAYNDKPARRLRQRAELFYRCGNIVESRKGRHVKVIYISLSPSSSPQHCTPGGTFWATMEVHYNGKWQTTTMYPRGCILCEKKNAPRVAP